MNFVGSKPQLTPHRRVPILFRLEPRGNIPGFPTRGTACWRPVVEATLLCRRKPADDLLKVALACNRRRLLGTLVILTVAIVFNSSL